MYTICYLNDVFMVLFFAEIMLKLLGLGFVGNFIQQNFPTVFHAFSYNHTYYTMRTCTFKCDGVQNFGEILGIVMM